MSHIELKISLKLTNPLLTQIRDDFDRWSVHKLSLIARVNAVKMNILPRLSYLFQCIPLFLPQSFFRKLDSLILEFILNKKKSPESVSNICKDLSLLEEWFYRISDFIIELHILEFLNIGSSLWTWILLQSG